jgi:hypothetical protein
VSDLYSEATSDVSSHTSGGEALSSGAEMEDESDDFGDERLLGVCSDLTDDDDFFVEAEAVGLADSYSTYSSGAPDFDYDSSQ